jgi:hypothetical protein
VLAALIVGMSGLALDMAHSAAAPAGSIEIGTHTPVELVPLVAARRGVIFCAPRVAWAAGPGRA